MKERKVKDAQIVRAQREMLAAIDIYRRLGYTRDKVVGIASSMYDFQVGWAEMVDSTPPAPAATPRLEGDDR